MKFIALDEYYGQDLAEKLEYYTNEGYSVISSGKGAGDSRRWWALLEKEEGAV